MMSLLFLAAASADLDSLSQAVAQCNRATVNPMFAGEAARRSAFLLDAYKQEEAIVADRLALADQRRAMRQDTSDKPADQKDLEKQLDEQQADIEDRQKALNDRRMLEGIREDAMDSLRHYFLLNCPAGGGRETAR